MRRIVNLLVCAAGLLGLTAGLDAKARTKPAPAPLNAGFEASQPADDAIIQHLEQHYGRQFRQLYRSELHLMRIVTQPTKLQFERIAADGETALKETIRKSAAAMITEPSENGRYDPRSTIIDGIAKLVETTLSPEQAARYRQELGERAFAAKQAIAQNLIAALDKVLLLTPEQRTKLGEFLEKNWHISWNHSQWLMCNGECFPRVPNTLMNSILTKAQQDVWRTIPKGNVRFGNLDMGDFQGLDIADEVWDDDPPKGGKSADKDKGVSKARRRP